MPVPYTLIVITLCALRASVVNPPLDLRIHALQTRSPHIQ